MRLSQGLGMMCRMLNDDAWSAVAELAASQHGCFTTAQAADNGLGRRQLDRARSSGVIVRVFPRVLRFVGAPLTWHARLAAATLSSGGVASHRSAARLHGFDGFTDSVIEVTVARGRRVSLPGVIGHRWTYPEPDFDHQVVNGIPCTSSAVTLAQLGAVAPAVAVERALDSALRNGANVRWIRETADRLHRPGPSGTGTLLRILDDERRSGALPDSWFERLVQSILHDQEIPRPTIQHDVVVASGRRYRLDLAWPEMAVGLECHSRTYHFGPVKEASDNLRDLELAGAGWEVLYLTWEQSRRPDDFVPLLAQTLMTRRQQLNVA